MMSGSGRVSAAILTILALAGAGGAFVFGVLAGEGGKGHLRNITSGVVCALVPVAVGAVRAVLANRKVRIEIGKRERAIAEREEALESKQQAEAKATEIQIKAEAQLIFALRARLSSTLYCLATIAARPADRQMPELIGRLTQAVVAAAAEHRDRDSARRSIFFGVRNDRLECVSYAGPEGLQRAERTAFTRDPADPLGRYMFRLLEDHDAVLVPDVRSPDVQVRFPRTRSYQTVIAAAVVAGDEQYGVLTLDAPEPGTLGKPDLEIVKTLASLLGVGLALATAHERQHIIPPQADKDNPLPVSND